MERGLGTLLNGVKKDYAAELKGITQIVAGFDGAGDEGFVNGVSLVPGPVEPTPALRNLIREIADGLLEDFHPGWGNGYGAYGDVTFDLKTNTAAIDFNEKTRDENDLDDGGFSDEPEDKDLFDDDDH